MNHRKKFRLLHGAGALRVKMNVSQEIFAQYLGISKSTVSMVENGHRSFPTRALVKLTEMEIAYASGEFNRNTSAAAPTVLQSAHEKEMLERKQHINRLDLSLVKYRLAKMTEQYTEIITGLSYIRFAQQLHGRQPGSQCCLAMERAMFTQQIKLRRCNPQRLARLEGRIAMLEVAVAGYENNGMDEMKELKTMEATNLAGREPVSEIKMPGEDFYTGKQKPLLSEDRIDRYDHKHSKAIYYREESVKERGATLAA